MLFEAKCVKLLRSKVFLLSKVFFEAKCASALHRVGSRQDRGSLFTMGETLFLKVIIRKLSFLYNISAIVGRTGKTVVLHGFRGIE